MKKNKTLIKDKEKVILQYIETKAGGVSANEISGATLISYVTVQKYLNKLVKEGILEVEDDNKK